MPRPHHDRLPVTGIIAVFDTPTVDGRWLRHLPHDDMLITSLPVPLLPPPGHGGGPVGQIDSITPVGHRLEATGTITGYPPGTRLPVAVDLDDATAHPFNGATRWRIGAVTLTDQPAWDNAVITVHAPSP